MAQEPVAFHLYKARHFYPLSEKGQDSKQNGNTKNFKADLLKIANAKLLTRKAFQAMVTKQIYTGRQMQNRILNVPHQEEEQFKADVYRSIIAER